jgi:SAM-dependent methyltransferase
MSEEAADRYVDSRRPTQYGHYALEQNLVGRWLRLCAPGATVLDLPCGTGRFSALTQLCGHRLVRADRSPAMLCRAKDQGPNEHVLGNVCCDLANPPFGDGSVDVVILWRLFHHLRSWEDRRVVLERAARMARSYLILSYYNRASLTYWSQRLGRALVRGRPKLGGAVWTSDLLAAARGVGLEPVERVDYRRYISVNSAVCFRPTRGV